MDEEGWVYLGRGKTELVSVTYESRSPHLTGPQNACHPGALELSIVEHGVGDGLIGRQSARLTAGRYGVIAPGVEHSSWTAEQPAVEVNIHLDAALVARVAEELGVRTMRRDWPAGAFVSPPEMLGVVAALKREVKDGAPPVALAMDGLAQYLAGLLVRRHLLTNTKPVALDRDRAERRLRRAAELMDAAPEEHFTVDRLADAAGMSRYHFVHAFKKQHGLPPYAYLIRLRVERAAELMRTTGLSLTTIAHELGFASSGRFSEAFKRAYGVTPSSWRQEHQRGLRSGAVVIRPSFDRHNIRKAAAQHP